MSWGNGFTVNQTLIQQYNLSDPTGFFEDISAVPSLVNRTVLSVHIYGPNITVCVCCFCVLVLASLRSRLIGVQTQAGMCAAEVVDHSCHHLHEGVLILDWHI